MDREFGWNDEITEEGGNYEPLPEGNYDFTVAKVERARSQGKGKLPPCNMAKVTFDVWGADDKREITVNFVLHSSLEWKLSQLFLSVSMKKHGEPLRMDWTGIIGKKGKCQVIIRKYVKNDGTKGVTNDITYLYAYDEQVTTVSPVVAQSAPQQYVQPTYPPQYVQPTYPPQYNTQPAMPNTATPNNWTPGSF